ncbi:STAS domain-containing protein [Streptomyces noursei]|uniref:STAS domain-containing protein n=1 Tax=Streptomyces noursei TaxID=1971 RepID=UPI001963B4E0|nr:STAS domain-containing protein [Streptomyces noursei]QRX90283.1 STAS domain-containing protein [Streptomyces noursei]
MTIQWRYTTHDHMGILSLVGRLDREDTSRFGGAVAWALARGRGPVILDLTALEGWTPAGQAAIDEAARQLATHGRTLELAAIPADGSLVPDDTCPPLPVHHDLKSAVAAHSTAGAPGVRQQWCTASWPTMS